MGVRKSYVKPEVKPYGDIRALTAGPTIKEFGVGDGTFLFNLDNPLRDQTLS
jgi:hypothetical protein